MFTGIIESTGEVVSVSDKSITIRTDLVDQLKTGGSIAVNGVCLTAAELEGGQLIADVMPETLKATNLGEMEVGSTVNLELAMKADGRFEGHVVSGHIDSTGKITKIEDDGNARLVTVQLPAGLERYIVNKGSIALNGISLTVVNVQERDVVVSIIPHTWEVTNFHALKEGDSINVEVDMMAKYAEKLLMPNS